MFVGSDRKALTARGQCASQVENSISKQMRRCNGPPPFCSRLEQYASNETGAAPASAASCTRSNCSFWVVLPTNV